MSDITIMKTERPSWIISYNLQGGPKPLLMEKQAGVGPDKCHYQKQGLPSSMSILLYSLTRFWLTLSWSSLSHEVPFYLLVNLTWNGYLSVIWFFSITQTADRHFSVKGVFQRLCPRVYLGNSPWQPLEGKILTRSFLLLSSLRWDLGTRTSFVSFKFVMDGAGWGRGKDVDSG